MSTKVGLAQRYQNKNLAKQKYYVPSKFMAICITQKNGDRNSNNNKDNSVTESEPMKPHS